MNTVKLNTSDGATLSLSSELLASLNQGLLGKLVTVDEEEYNSVRKVWNGLITNQPGVIVCCRGVADVIDPNFPA